jgi:hypothetical protein
MMKKYYFLVDPENDPILSRLKKCKIKFLNIAFKLMRLKVR